jgi:V/A-type H+-transporting ATPase subunit E
MSQNLDTHSSSKGIQELIDLMRDKGVSAGKDEGQKIIDEAEERAAWIIAQAEEEAAKVRAEAEKNARFVSEAGKEALDIAFRDIKLKLKDELSSKFAGQLRKLISKELQDPETLKKILISAASKSKVPDEPMTIVLPDRVVGVNELRKDPTLLGQDPLIEMLSEVAATLFSQGVKIETSDKADGGLTFLLKGGEITVELTEHSLADLVLVHLQPRFRAILEGVVA